MTVKGGVRVVSGKHWQESVKKKHRVQECHLIGGRPTKRKCPFHMQLATFANFGPFFLCLLASQLGAKLVAKLFSVNLVHGAVYAYFTRNSITSFDQVSLSISTN